MFRYRLFCLVIVFLSIDFLLFLVCWFCFSLLAVSLASHQIASFAFSSICFTYLFVLFRSPLVCCFNYLSSFCLICLLVYFSCLSFIKSTSLSLVCFNYLFCYYFIYFTFVCSLHLPLFHLHYLALICLPFFSFASLSFSSVLLTCLLVYSSYFFLHLKAKILFILCILAYPPFLLHYFLFPILSYVFFQPFTHPSILSIFPSTSPSLSTKASFFTFISVFRGF